MKCSSCANTIPDRVAYCPICGATTPYSIAQAGVAPDSPTTRSTPFGTPEQKPATNYGSQPYGTPYGTPVYNPYESSNPYLTPLPAPPSPQPQRPKRGVSTIGLLIIAAVVVVVVAVSAIGFFVVSRNQSPSTTIATTPTLSQQSTASATASPTPASAANPYGGGTLALNDPLRDNSQGNSWAENSTNGVDGCMFKESAYHALLQQGRYTTCTGGPSFRNLAMEARVTVLKGDCGGIVFRSDSSGHHYLFEICPNGGYGVYLYFGPAGDDYKTIHTGSSQAIQAGLNQANLIAAVAVNQTIRLFVNKQQIYQMTDNNYGAGQCGFAIDSSGAIIGTAAPTEVMFENLKVWAL